MTGVDRVEAAYLQHLLVQDTPVFGLVRSAMGYLLLDRQGMALLQNPATAFGKPDLIGRIAYRHDPRRGGAEAALRAGAVARCWRGGLQKMLLRHLPVGGTYLNVGHANLNEECFLQIKAAGMQTAVLVHDTIPLDHPEFCRPYSLAPFQRKMSVVAHHADLVIHTTSDARAKTERHFAALGRIPTGIVAALGVELPPPGPLPFEPHHPYFLCLGTIEPRKNHALLLDVWEKLPAPAPHLYIVGRRGWSNEAVFARLDRLPQDGPVHEMAGLDDAAVVQVLQGAKALLFPSFAEGFGLPALEAASLGTQVIASNLPVFKQSLQDFAIYLDPSETYSWLETIQACAVSTLKVGKSFKPPLWTDHFRIVFAQM